MPGLDGVHAVFSTTVIAAAELAARPASPASPARALAESLRPGPPAGSVVLLAGMDGEVPVPYGAGSRVFEIAQPLTDTCMQTTNKALSSAVCILVINFQLSSCDEIDAMLLKWESDTTGPVAFGQIPVRSISPLVFFLISFIHFLINFTHLLPVSCCVFD